MKRKWHWGFSRKKYAINLSPELLTQSLVDHSSMLLRPLKDVDMQYQYNKVTNLLLAINKLDGLVIRPNETFSLWYLVGNPTKSRGYLKGLILNNGKIGYDYGGGLCQLGNLMYWMILHTPLKVTERWRHSYDVFPDVNRKLPFGSGATLSYNYIDLQFKNITRQDFQIKLWLTDERLHGKILSNTPLERNYEVYEDYHRFQQETWGGYTRHNALRRRVFDEKSGLEIKDELITENHAVMMYRPLIGSDSV